jgi:hypothetical protein
MIEFLGGAVSLAFLIAGLHFLRFWKRTGDRFFLHFACAFWLFAINQILVSVPNAVLEQVRYAYVLRVVGYLVILLAIVGKNAFPSGRQK